MSDFRIIDDGREEMIGSGWAAHWFADFGIEFLRAIARGSDDYKVHKPLLDMLQKVDEDDLTVGQFHTIVKQEIEAYRDDLTVAFIEEPNRRYYINEILKAALRVVAERHAGDPAAKGRESQREQSLLSAIEDLNEYRASLRSRVGRVS